MATINIDNDMVTWSGNYDLTLRTDRSIVPTTNLRNNIYTSGATQWQLDGTLVSRNEGSRDYLDSIFTAAFVNGDNFRITLHNEVLGQTSGATGISVQNAATAGSNTFTLNTNVQLALLRQGVKFNVAGSDRLYVINSINTTTRALTFYPLLDKNVAANAAIDLTPTLLADLVQSDIEYGSLVGNPNVRRIDVTFQESLA